ncbi:hypothetical protein [Bacillus amyloliquefaciens]|uniref:hypothetical protein n=1 Tax=Bacillus amyloliquefaciens TaxID=1390 RepID=UPI0028079317|nr:hypothetical protein [Bacillus amyloliquefaciens]MDQ8094892.1 hypothetical protein [Bacillus amyloliquefaciens]
MVGLLRYAFRVIVLIAAILLIGSWILQSFPQTQPIFDGVWGNGSAMLAEVKQKFGVGGLVLLIVAAFLIFGGKGK